MFRIFTFLVAAVFCLSAAPAFAWHPHHHGGFFWGMSLGWCCGPYQTPYSGYDYYGFGAAYLEPPTVVYTRPAPVYPVTYIQPQVIQPHVVQEAISVTSASEVFTDSNGQTCRNFQSIISGSQVNGTACLQPDGSWRTVGK